MFLRFFHIALIAAYFFCCFGEIIEAPHISILKVGAFIASKSSNPPRTHFITTSLPKHIHTFSQVKVENHTIDSWENNLPTKSVITLYCVASENNLYKITLESPLNKAPPYFL